MKFIKKTGNILFVSTVIFTMILIFAFTQFRNDIDYNKNRKAVQQEASIKKYNGVHTVVIVNCSGSKIELTSSNQVEIATSTYSNNVDESIKSKMSHDTLYINSDDYHGQEDVNATLYYGDLEFKIPASVQHINIINGNCNFFAYRDSTLHENINWHLDDVEWQLYAHDYRKEDDYIYIHYLNTIRIESIHSNIYIRENGTPLKIHSLQVALNNESTLNTNPDFENNYSFDEFTIEASPDTRLEVTAKYLKKIKILDK
ncbi:MAG: hypothetical protein WCP57_00430 [Bacteroidota bacterium]